MGLKFFREETKHDVYYPSKDAPDAVRFTLKVASARARRRVLDCAETDPTSGKSRILMGSWTEEKLKACVAGWDEKRLGRPFTVDALLELDVDVERFLVAEIDRLDLLGLSARAEEMENPTLPSRTDA